MRSSLLAPHFENIHFLGVIITVHILQYDADEKVDHGRCVFDVVGR
ncbi:hypothetical protein GGD38_000154 [Chitinophagaceae bacterium OAS944]|nr:hypothetical protein [Chitinophagaceae bacterium OAS944]